MNVMELMRHPVRTVAAKALVSDAIRTLVQSQVSAVPVLGDDETPVGVLTTRDVLRAETAREPGGARRWLFETTPVRDIMSPWPPSIAPDADIQEAAQSMLYLDVQRLFVVVEGKVVGVISQTDIVDAVAVAKIP
jgi:acetoin utilization protein AcuB